jgi:thiol-disulfide isomerase/thioredoxin
MFALIAAVAAALLGVLYWKTAVTVHAPPPKLALLKPTSPVRPVPALAFTGPGGKVHNLQDFRGKTVLLNLWAPWCAPCVKELPALAALQKAVPGGRFVVVPVDVGREGQGEAQTFLQAHGAGALTTYVDSNAALLRAFGGYGLPMTILIDKDGNEIARAEGAPNWAAADSIAYFRGLVGQ